MKIRIIILGAGALCIGTIFLILDSNQPKVAFIEIEKKNQIKMLKNESEDQQEVHEGENILIETQPLDIQKPRNVYTTQELYELVDSGDYSTIESFFYANTECKIIKGYDSKSDYLANYALSSTMDMTQAETIYENCKNIKIKSFEEEKILYLTALAEGSKEAEYILGLLNPPLFKDRIYWLSRAATWDSKSENIIAESIYESSADDYQKLFWSYIFKQDSNRSVDEIEHRIVLLEGSLENTTIEKIDRLSRKWHEQSDEEVKRQILRTLEEI